MKHDLSCENIWDLLSAYADNIVSEDEAAIVERHIAQCPLCASDLRFLRESASLLSRTPDVAPPIGLKNAILSATIYRTTWIERIRSYATSANSAYVAAALAGLCLVAVISHSGRDPLTPILEIPQHRAVAQSAKPLPPSPVSVASGVTEEAASHAEPTRHKKAESVHLLMASGPALTAAPHNSMPERYLRNTPVVMRGGSRISTNTIPIMNPERSYTPEATIRTSPPPSEVPNSQVHTIEANTANVVSQPVAQQPVATAPDRPRIILASATVPLSANSISNIAQLRSSLRSGYDASHLCDRKINARQEVTVDWKTNF